MTRFATLAVACALAISSVPSFAASESSASITGLTFTLIDLNPRDGIAPSFNFLNTAGSTVLSVNASDSYVGESDSASRTRVGTFSFSREYLTDLANAGAQSSINANALTASGYAAGPGTSYNAGSSTGIVNGSYYNGLNLSLSANSLLLIEASVTLSGAASNPQSCSYYYCSSSEQASASASMYLSYSYYTGTVNSSYSGSQSLSLQAVAHGGYTDYNVVYNPVLGYYEAVYFTTPGTEESKSLTDVLTQAFTNATSSTQVAALGFSVNVSGSGNTVPAVPEVDTLVLAAAGAGVLLASRQASAVPEPEGYALGLAGLGVLACLARRRRPN